MFNNLSSSELTHITGGDNSVFYDLGSKFGDFCNYVKPAIEKAAQVSSDAAKRVTDTLDLVAGAIKVALWLGPKIL